MAAEGFVALLGAVSRRARRPFHVLGERSGSLDADAHTQLDHEHLATADVTLAQLGVHPAITEVTYRARDLDDQLDKTVGEGRAVLLVGDSMAGKSRMAAELVRTRFAHRPIVIPSPHDGLARLFGQGGPPPGSVVWLDDLERFVVDGGIDPRSLEQLLASRAIVVATVRGNAYRSFAPRGDIRPPQRALIDRFTVVWVRDDAKERFQLAETIDDPTLREQVASRGLGVALGGGYQTLDRFRSGAIQHQFGVALVQTAVDWRRIGREVIGRDSLVALARQRIGGGVLTEESIEEGLAWATAPVDRVVQLLRPVTGGFRANDYLLDHLSGPNTESVPDATRREGLVGATPMQAFALGDSAHFAGRLDEAAIAYQQTIDSGSDIAPWAAGQLGDVLREQGHLDEAAIAYQRAVDSGGGAAPWAAGQLGDMHREHVHLGETASTYQGAVDSDSQIAPWAALKLGVVLLEQGRLGEAGAALQRAVDSNHPDIAPMAASRLGDVRRGQGRLGEAANAFQRAVDSDHPDIAPLAASKLGGVLRTRGRLDEAASAFQRAVDSDSYIAPFVAVTLGDVRLEQGREGEAVAAYELAVDSHHPDIAPLAEIKLQTIREG